MFLLYFLWKRPRSAWQQLAERSCRVTWEMQGWFSSSKMFASDWNSGSYYLCVSVLHFLHTVSNKWGVLDDAAPYDLYLLLIKDVVWTYEWRTVWWTVMKLFVLFSFITNQQMQVQVFIYLTLVYCDEELMRSNLDLQSLVQFYVKLMLKVS